MNILKDKLFLCYAWEDIVEVKSIISDIEHELDAKNVFPTISDQKYQINDAIIRAVEDAELFVVFISDAARMSEYVKQCSLHARNINKNILPISIGRSSFFSLTPSEFKFRVKPYVYKNEGSRAQLFAQLKATLGINVESGDNYGSRVHVITDLDAKIVRYGTQIGVAKVNEDSVIRLTKGTHLLTFIPIDGPEVSCDKSYQVNKNDGEQYLKLQLSELIQEKIEEEKKKQREADKRRAAEEKRRQEELAIQNKPKSQPQHSSNPSNEGCFDGCLNGTIGTIVGIGFLIWILSQL